MKLGRNIKIFIKYFLGPLLFIGLSWAIYREIKQQPDLGKAWQHILKALQGPQLLNLVAVLLLMILNWSIEAIKWKICVARIQPVGFLKAFRAVLSGVSFSVSTPNRIGEYLGRVLYMDDGNRLKAISLTIVGSISQLIITLAAGITGAIILFTPIIHAHPVSPGWMRILLGGLIIVLGVLTLFYFRLPLLIRWIDHLPKIKRFAYLLEALEDFNATLLWRLLSLSTLRFLVFIVQYYLLFSLFDVQVSWWQGFWGVSVSFLVMAIIPTFAIAELGLRGEVGLKLLGLFSSNGLGIWMTTVTIWLVNLVLPAIAGSLLILSIKKFITDKSAPASPVLYPEKNEDERK